MQYKCISIVQCCSVQVSICTTTAGLLIGIFTVEECVMEGRVS